MKKLVIFFLLMILVAATTWIVLLFANTHDRNEKAIEIINKADELISKIEPIEIDTTGVGEAMSNIKKQKAELELARKKLDEKLEQPRFFVQNDNKEKDRLIADLRKRINDLQNELNNANWVAVEKKKEQEVSVIAPVGIVNEDRVISPDDQSLIIQIDSGDLVVPVSMDIYLIPYSKKVKKLQLYEASCDLSLINDFPGKMIAEKYNDVYFFNSVPKGKYLVKICTYYGGYKVVDKKEGKQTQTIKLSPPLQ